MAVQARARGFLVRQRYSEVMGRLEEEREERRVALRRVLCIQARLRGYLVRTGIKGELLRDARHKKWVTLITLLQANCRGNLTRRMTVRMLEVERKRRIAEEVLWEKGVVVVQARARGFVTRRQYVIMKAKHRQRKELENTATSEGTVCKTTSLHHHLLPQQCTSSATTFITSSDTPSLSHDTTATPFSDIATPTLGVSSDVTSPTFEVFDTTSSEVSSATSTLDQSCSNLDTPTSVAVKLAPVSIGRSGRDSDEVALVGREEGTEDTKKKCGEEEEVRDAELLDAETLSVQALAHARGIQMMEAQHARQRMDAMCSMHELLGLAREGRDRPTYFTELEHSSKPLPGPAVLGLVHDRMTHWQETRCKRKKVDHTRLRKDTCSEHTVQPSPAPVAGSCTLTRAQLLGASPKATELSEVVEVLVQGSRKPVALNCLEVCPQLRTLSMSRCGLKTLAGLDGCPLLVEILVPV